MKNRPTMLTRSLLGALLACVAGFAFAQTPTITFTVETAAATAGQVTPKLTWATTPAAASCTASGDAAWTGTKAASGTVTLAAITPPKSYTLRCSWPGETTADLSWTAPTQNTDGTSLTNLAGYSAHWGPSATSLVQSAQITNPATTDYKVTALTPGTWFFAVRAINTAGGISALSNVASKVITAPVELTQTVGIKVPNAPTGLTVE